MGRLRIGRTATGAASAWSGRSSSVGELRGDPAMDFGHRPFGLLEAIGLPLLTESGTDRGEWTVVSTGGAQQLLHVGQAQADLGVGPVDHHLDVDRGSGQLHGLGGQLEVLTLGMSRLASMTSQSTRRQASTGSENAPVGCR